jgi:hypothetical protein
MGSINLNWQRFSLPTSMLAEISSMPEQGIMRDPEITVEENPTNSARSRVRNGPLPEWVSPCGFDESFKDSDAVQVTHLLVNHQIHAERHELFIRRVIRLETMDAVQHWSQWRLQFEPKRQSVTLHFLKIRRGQNEIDQSNLAKAHFLQREEGLDKFVIQGWFTLLMILEDVRPGDILDFAYTTSSSSEIFPNHGGHFFSLQPGMSVGKYHFAVQFADERQRKWMSSSAELTPKEKRESGMTFWEWFGEKYIAPKPEANTPSWHIGNLWIQVSDFDSWQTVAGGISKMWVAGSDDPTVVELAKQIEDQEPDLLRRIERAIQLIQDECRYLSINLELGGQVPAPPATVARRRFGDCKDLSFLLVNLLTKFGVRARPILVNTALRKSIRDFLPLPSLFDHAIVEVEINGERCWIDTTFKQQGGGPLNRFVPDYGCGLPVDEAATGLVDPPKQKLCNLFDLHHHVLLDARNGLSLMAVTLQADGNQADQHRFQLQKFGLEEWGKQRLQSVINRYRNAKRVGELKCRDDRKGNVFALTEVFEIEFKLGKHASRKLCVFQLPGNWMSSILPMPPNGQRHSPFLLPYPCAINYAVDVDIRGIIRTKLKEPRADISNDLGIFSRTDRIGFRNFTMRLALQTKVEAVPAKKIEEYIKFVEKVGSNCSRVLNLPAGHPRPAVPPGFGDLPAIGQIRPKFTPESKKPNESISPVVRKISFWDRVHQGLISIWPISILLIWIIAAIIRAITH